MTDTELERRLIVGALAHIPDVIDGDLRVIDRLRQRRKQCRERAAHESDRRHVRHRLLVTG